MTEKPIVLLIEDSDDDAFFFSHAVERLAAGLEVQRARDGQEAIDYLLGLDHFDDRARFPIPHALLVDLKMPICDGYQFLEWKRAQPELAGIPAIVLSSSALPADVRRCYELGAHSYTVKASSMDTMRNRIEAFRTWWFEHCATCRPSSIPATH